MIKEKLKKYFNYIIPDSEHFTLEQRLLKNTTVKYGLKVK